MVPDTMASDEGDTEVVYSAAAGYVGVAVAVIFFGSNFVPVKKIETGDGLFFQWVLCIGIWCVGLLMNLYRNSPTLYPLCMLGGFFWTTGNLCTVPIIKTIGLGKGMLIWATANMVAGWACGRFGLIDIAEQKPSSPALNYSGVVMCLISVVIFFFIKSESRTQVKTLHPQEDRLISSETEDEAMLPISRTLSREDISFLERMSPMKQRIFGSCAAVFAGLLYGIQFQPIYYVQQNYDGASDNALDFVFAHFCGIFFTSTVYMLIYTIVTRNKPKLYPEALLPGVASGLMWAVADICWFIANQALEETVSFPIITSGPAVVGALWGVLLFKEIKGRKNLLLLLLATCVTVTGAILTGLSNR